MATQRIAAKWDQFDRAYIIQNFPKMTWKELLFSINELRPKSQQVDLGALRHETRRLGLNKGIQIRWSKADIKFLKDNYRSMGNVEIGKILTEKQRTFRKINGQKVYRVFTKKNVEKKMKLLGLKRSPAELAVIKSKAGCFTKEDNLYTRGIRQVATDGDTRIWSCNGIKRRVVKDGGKFIPYTRWFYLNFIGPIPNGYRVYHIDGDILNDEPDNLGLANTKGLISLGQLNHAVWLLKQRLSKITIALSEAHSKQKAALKRESYDALDQQIVQYQSDVSRIRKLINKYQKRIDKISGVAPLNT